MTPTNLSLKREPSPQDAIDRETQLAQQQLALDATAKPQPTGVTVITIDGSHSKLRTLRNNCARESIPSRGLGPVNLGSNRMRIAVPSSAVEKIRGWGLGVTVAREQPAYLAAETAESYFAK